MDKLTKEERSANMRRIKSKDTAPEMIVRRTLHSMGYRYRLHARDLPGKPDIVFRKRRRVVFVHGCYWHGHESASCRRTHMPKSNLTYWAEKLARNKARDEANLKAIREAGWSALVIWECQVKDLEALRSQLADFMD